MSQMQVWITGTQILPVQTAASDSVRKTRRWPPELADGERRKQKCPGEKVPGGRRALGHRAASAEPGQRMLKCKQPRILCLPPPGRSQECKHAAASSPTVQFVSSDVSSNPLTPHLIFLLTKSYRQKRPLLLPVA